MARLGVRVLKSEAQLLLLCTLLASDVSSLTWRAAAGVQDNSFLGSLRLPCDAFFGLVADLGN